MFSTADSHYLHFCLFITKIFEYKALYNKIEKDNLSNKDPIIYQ